jgi:tripartite ATP-independent transporter DctM subunit
MDSGVLSLVMLASLFFCLAVGQWTAFTLGSVGVLILLLSKGLIGLTSISSVVWNITSSYILISIPMFLLMGEIILRSGVSTKFYAGVVALLGRLPGGLLHANIASCAVFSAVSGSSVATAASVGTVAIPELRRAGYEPRAVLGSLAAGGTLGILIPPSIVLVLYGAGSAHDSAVCNLHRMLRGDQTLNFSATDRATQ